MPLVTAKDGFVGNDTPTLSLESSKIGVVGQA
jgi:hypothetical protein